MASAESHRITSPRWTSARSYSRQFPTRYVVLYFGGTLDFISRIVCRPRPQDQPVDDARRREGQEPCTKAAPWRGGYVEQGIGHSRNRSGAIITHTLTDDATTELTLIDAVDGDLASVTADGPARRALVVTVGGVPRRLVTSCRRQTAAWAGGRRGRSARLRWRQS